MKAIAFLFIAALAVATSGLEWSEDARSVIDVALEHLSMRNVVWVCDGLARQKKISSLKEFFTGDDQTASVVGSHFLANLGSELMAKSDAVICTEDEDLGGWLERNQAMEVRRTWLLVSSGNDLAAAFPAGINQRIFSLDVRTGELSESYQLQLQANKLVRNTLGAFRRGTGANDDDWRFSPATEDTFLARRSDLQGIALRVMVSVQSPFIIFDESEHLNNANHFLTESNDKLAKMDDEEAIGGLFDELTDILVREMNWTASKFARVDRAWGAYDRLDFISCR